MQNRLFLPLAGLLFLGIAHAQPPSPFKLSAAKQAGPARRLLRRMVQAELSIAFSAQEVTVGRNGRTMEQLVKHDPKLGMRRESIKPEGVLLVDNGHRQFLIRQKEKHYRESKSQLAETKKQFQAALKNTDDPLTVEIQGQDMVAGRFTDVILVHRIPDNAGPSRRFWVDRETGLRLRTEERGPDGRILSSAYYLTLNLAPTFREEDFRKPAVPANFRVSIESQKEYHSFEEAAKEGIAPKQPTWLPPGFRLRAILSQVGDRPRVTIRWGNSLSVISVVCGKGALPNAIDKSLDKASCGFYTTPGGERLYALRAADGYRLVIGSLPDDQLKRISDSIH